jgi:NAD-dependent SIR2 family protein deacetylase
MKNKILIFTGAGVSKESGVDTFRDNGGLWMNYDIKKVAHIDAWKKNPQLVLDFYNMRRNDMMNVSPNLAHEIIADLEKRQEMLRKNIVSSQRLIESAKQDIETLKERKKQLDVLRDLGKDSLSITRNLKNPKKSQDVLDQIAKIDMDTESDKS